MKNTFLHPIFALLWTVLLSAGCDKLVKSPVEPTPPPEIGVQGKVTDARTGQPIEGAQIVIADLGGDVTDATGHFALTVAFEPGRTYYLTCAKPGYKPFSLQVTAAEADQLQSASIALERDLVTRSIAGQVVDSQTGKPLAGALVTTIPQTLRATTDSEGRYLIDQGLEVGTYEVRVEAEGFAVETVKVRVIDSERPQVADFRLERRQPYLLVSTHSLDAGLDRNSLLVTVSSQDGTPITFRATTPSGETWLSVDPVSGVVSEVAVPINVRITRDNLPPGTYTGEVVIVSDGGEEHIEVKMQVPEPARGKLFVSPLKVDFGPQDERRTITLTNSGNAPLEGRIWSGLPALSLSDSTFTLSPDANTTVTLTIHRQGLATRAYEEAVVYVETGDDQRVVTVAFEVPETPVLVFSAEVLDFGVDRDTLEVMVSNAGMGSGRFRVTGLPEWATIDRTEGTALDEGLLVISVRRDALPSGSYEHHLRLSYEGGEVYLPLRVEVPYPETRLLSGPVQDQVIHTANPVFELGGGEVYRWRLDGEPWSTPATESTIALSDLNEGQHLFEGVAGRRAGGEDPEPIQVGFVVDTVDGPALWLSTDAHRVSTGGQVQVELVAEGIGQLESFQFELRFDPAVLEVVSLAPGKDLEVDGELPALWFAESFEGVIKITGGMTEGLVLDGQQRSVLVQAVFRRVDNGEARIEIQQADLRAALDQRIQAGTLKGIKIAAL